MATTGRTKTNPTGLKQLGPRQWQCRITKVIDGKRRDLLYRIDERTGKPLETMTEAAAYRQYILQKIQEERLTAAKPKPAATFQDVWEIYKRDIAPTKAPQTVVKHESVWNNHLEDFCKNKTLEGVSVGEINAFLADKYFNTELSFHYIEGFLKVFYLLYGVAYSYKLIDLDTLNRYTVDKKARISMPKMTAEDTEEEGRIEIYSIAEIEKIYNIFKNTDLECAFLIAYYTGARESEIFALMFEDFNSDRKTLTINKQLLCIDGVWKLTGVKTLAGVRTIELPDVLNNFLIDKRIAHIKAKQGQAYKNRATEIVIDVRGKQPKEIQGGNFINRKLLDGLQGKLLTTNSLKFYAKKIKQETGLQFKMHKIRKTHLSNLAAQGFPVKALMSRAGHKRLSTSMRYYITADETAQEQQTRILNTLTTTDEVISFDVVDTMTGQTFQVKKKKSEVEAILNHAKP